MVNHVENIIDCSGCGVCAAVCSYNAITMVADALGFLYPKVDIKSCVNCGLCEKICPFHDGYEKNSDFVEPLAFASRHKNLDEVETSRSGATFIALSDYILDAGGVVYGAGYTEDFQVVHKRATTKKERDEFKGSKYVQSKMGDVYAQVKEDLQSGLKVLFSGTPCQTAGLYAFIGKKWRENLYLVDIICHGVASPSVWHDYLDYLKHKENDKIISVNFRDKTIFGWSGLHKESFKFEKKGIKTYNYIFYNPYMMRRSCNSCVFANLSRPSDITLGDFWGWQRVVSDFNLDDKGVSLVLCNTRKGLDLFNSVHSCLNVVPVSLEDSLQPNLQHPTPIDSKRDSFENDYKLKGFKYVMKKYGDVGMMFQVKRVIRFLKRFFR